MTLEQIFIAANGLALLGWILLAFAPRWRLTHALVVSGGASVPLPDGRVVGYRLLRPGEQRFLIPFVELATSMSLRPFPVNAHLERVFAPGGETWTVEASLLLKVDPTNPHGAVERFLGQPEEAIARIGREVLEGALRETVAEQAPGDRERLRALLEARLDENLSTLGLAVETLLGLDAQRTMPATTSKRAP